MEAYYKNKLGITTKEEKDRLCKQVVDLFYSELVNREYNRVTLPTYNPKTYDADFSTEFMKLEKLKVEHKQAMDKLTAEKDAQIEFYKKKLRASKYRLNARHRREIEQVEKNMVNMAVYKNLKTQHQILKKRYEALAAKSRLEVLPKFLMDKIEQFKILDGYHEESQDKEADLTEKEVDDNEVDLADLEIDEYTAELAAFATDVFGPW